uniref:Uncharacterized protein ORF-c21_027 n=1 Tax=Saccharolobus solfataricus TaxID=2287 RepID=Q9UWX5_SACSO|nr:hypothetical protein [Saccharolobus solfataricus P2]
MPNCIMREPFLSISIKEPFMNLTPLIISLAILFTSTDNIGLFERFTNFQFPGLPFFALGTVSSFMCKLIVSSSKKLSNDKLCSNGCKKLYCIPITSQIFFCVSSAVTIMQPFSKQYSRESSLASPFFEFSPTISKLTRILSVISFNFFTSSRAISALTKPSLLSFSSSAKSDL